MGTFTIERVVDVSPLRMWDVITDWAAYARWLPLTTMRLDQGPTRVGWSFARVIDQMAAEAVRAPGHHDSGHHDSGHQDFGHQDFGHHDFGHH